MSNEDIFKYLDNLHEKIIRSSFAKNVTENEITALIECKTLLNPLKPKPYIGYEGKCRCGAVFLDNLTKHCGNCGQRLDWERDNE